MCVFTTFYMLSQYLTSVGAEAVFTTTIAYLKIDVEGSELPVIEGISRDHWPLVRSIAVEVNEVPAAASPLMVRN